MQLKWLKEPKDVQVSVGRRQLELVCDAEGFPAPKIEWTKVDDPNRQFGSSNVLHFNSVGQSEAGEYECRASNGVDSDLVKRIKLQVLGK